MTKPMSEDERMDKSEMGGLAMRVYGNVQNLQAAGFVVLPTMNKLSMIEAANEYTRQRQREIAELEHAISSANESMGCDGCGGVPGILIELGEAALAEKKRGMK